MSTRLNNKTILITRPREQAAEMVAEVERQGGRALVVPMIAISDPPSWDECDAAIGRLESYEVLIFASAQGARKFLERCATFGVTAEQLGRLAVYAVGRKTAEEAARLGVRIADMPEEYSGQSLVAFLADKISRGARVLLPRGSIGRHDIADGLESLGAVVEPVTVYATSDAGDPTSGGEIWEALQAGSVDAVAFASPSAVRNFADALPAGAREQLCAMTALAAIGPTTAAAIRKQGWQCSMIASEATSSGLVTAIADYFEQ